jgi:hypothetical protein
MIKKIFVGMLVVFIAIAIASAGYKFGQYLAHSKSPALPENSASPV